MKEYTTDEYDKAKEMVDFYNSRAIAVLRNCGVEEVRKWHGNCMETFVSCYQRGDGETIVDVVLWMGDEYTPSHHSFEFPWRLMNVRNELLPEEYSKWRKAEDERLAARKAAKDKYWAEVRAKYKLEHPGENSL